MLTWGAIAPTVEEIALPPGEVRLQAPSGVTVGSVGREARRAASGLQPGAVAKRAASPPTRFYVQGSDIPTGGSGAAFAARRRPAE